MTVKKRIKGVKGKPRGRALTPERARELIRRRWSAPAAGALALAGGPAGPAPADDLMPQRRSAEGLGAPGGSTARPLAARRRQVRDAILLEDGQRLGDVMDDWQREDFEALDDPQYKHAYFERPRGHSKTGDVASEAVVELLTGAGQQLFCLAADEDQARILKDDVAGKLQRGGFVKSGAVKVLKNRITSKAGSTLQVLPADVASSWGLRPDWVACDEIVEWRHRSLWESLYTATGKRPRCRVLVISTAGWDKSHFSWDIRSGIAAVEADWYFSSRGQCASWIDPAWLAQQARTLPSHVYARLHENRWVDGVGAFLRAAEVDAVFALDLPPAMAGDRWALGLDVGLTKDRTVLAPLCWTGDRQHLVVGAMQTWQGSSGEKVDLTAVEDAAYEASKRLHAPIWLDPFQAVSMAQRLRQRGCVVKEYTVTGESRRHLFAGLLKVIRDRQLVAQPHPMLRAELLGLEVKETLAGFRVDHKPGRFDDHVFAVALGIAGALEHGAGWGFLPAEAHTKNYAQGTAASGTPGSTLRNIDDERGGLVVNPSGRVERYYDPRGDEPRQVREEVVHVMNDDAHRSVCRQCSRDFLKYVGAHNGRRPDGRIA